MLKRALLIQEWDVEFWGEGDFAAALSLASLGASVSLVSLSVNGK